MMSPVHTNSISVLDGDIAVTRLISDTEIHCSKNHAASSESSRTISQLPKLCVKIRILMHRIFSFYFVGAFFQYEVNVRDIRRR